jgi:hypothetical protein
MAGAKGGRAARYAAEFEAAQERLIRRLESLTDEQWRRPGRNYPQQLNQEDERRTVGVIAHHVAIAAPRLLERIQALAEGRPLPPFAPEAVSRDNARHAADHADVTREEVSGCSGSSGHGSRPRCGPSPTTAWTARGRPRPVP